MLTLLTALFTMMAIAGLKGAQTTLVRDLASQAGVTDHVARDLPINRNHYLGRDTPATVTVTATIFPSSCSLTGGSDSATPSEATATTNILGTITTAASGSSEVSAGGTSTVAPSSFTTVSGGSIVPVVPVTTVSGSTVPVIPGSVTGTSGFTGPTAPSSLSGSVSATGGSTESAAVTTTAGNTTTSSTTAGSTTAGSTTAGSTTASESSSPTTPSSKPIQTGGSGKVYVVASPYTLGAFLLTLGMAFVA